MFVSLHSQYLRSKTDEIFYCSLNFHKFSHPLDIQKEGSKSSFIFYLKFSNSIMEIKQFLIHHQVAINFITLQNFIKVQ